HILCCVPVCVHSGTDHSAARLVVLFTRTGLCVCACVRVCVCALRVCDLHVRLCLQWKFLLLPYAASPIISRVFHNCERARTWASHVHQHAGLFASVNDVTKGNEPIPSYISATGVQEARFVFVCVTAFVACLLSSPLCCQVAFQRVDRLDVVTPCAAL